MLPLGWVPGFRDKSDPVPSLKELTVWWGDTQTAIPTQISTSKQNEKFLLSKHTRGEFSN